MKKIIRLLVMVVAITMALSSFAMAAFADSAPDYSDAKTLAEAVLTNYTKNFDTCDSSSGSATVQSINAALDKTLSDAGSSAHWNDTFKSWTIVKNGSTNYVILSKAVVADATVGKYIFVTKVDAGTVTEGIAKVALTKAGTYKVITASSFCAVNGSTELVIGKDCSDMPLLLKVMNEALKSAKANSATGSVSGRIDSSSSSWDVSETVKSNYAMFIEGINAVAADVFSELGISLDYSATTWSIKNSGNSVAELYVAETVTDTQINTDESLRADGVKIIVYKYDFDNGEFVRGQAPVILNTADNDLNNGTYIIDRDNWNAAQQPATSSETASVTSSVQTSSESSSVASSETSSVASSEASSVASSVETSVETSSVEVSSEVSSVASSTQTSSVETSSQTVVIVPESIPLTSVPASSNTVIEIESEDIPLEEMPDTGAFDDVKILLMAGSGLLFAITPMLGRKKKETADEKAQQDK